jgi:predicted nicotinamide N-methyase
MSAWIVEEFLEEFKDKTVLELGAGPGLIGFIAAHRAKAVILTDYQDIVMELIDKNL